MRATFAVQKAGKLAPDASLVLVVLFFCNTYFVLRNGYTVVGMRRRRLSLRKRDVFDLFTHFVVYYSWILSECYTAAPLPLTYSRLSVSVLELCSPLFRFLLLHHHHHHHHHHHQ